MASTYSPSLRLELIGAGEQSGTWNITTNNNLGTLLEQAITGVAAITMSDADVTLTAYNGVSDQSRQAVLVATGTNTAVRSLIAPLVTKTYIVKNSTTGGFAITIRGATGASASIPNGSTSLVYCDGVNFYLGFYNTTTATTIAGGIPSQLLYQSATGVTSFIPNGTAGQVLTSNGTAAPYWNTAGTSTYAANISNGAANQLVYQTGPSSTGFILNGTAGQVLTANASGAPSFQTSSSTTATNLAGGTAGNIPYQASTGVTSYINNGSSGQSLISNGSSTPSWGTPATASYATSSGTSSACSGNAATVTNGVYTSAANTFTSNNTFNGQIGIGVSGSTYSGYSLVVQNTGGSGSSIAATTTATAIPITVAVNSVGTPLQAFYTGTLSGGLTNVGTITTTGSSTSYNTTSDYRLKENVVALTSASTRIAALHPVRFDWIADSTHKTVDGFIAHEVQAVVPEAITGVKDEIDVDGKPVYQGIDQSKIVPLLTAALQEALARIEALELKLGV